MGAGTVYNNVVIENRINNILNTQLEARTLMTIDNSLQGDDGVTKKIKKYVYTGTAQAVDKDGTATAGSVAYVDKDYVIQRVQAKFVYNDTDAMTDSKYVETGIDGMPKSMVNYANAKFFGELEKIGNAVATTAFNYNAIVDAIADMDVEDENGIYILGGNDFKKAIRKDVELKAVNQGEIIFNGQIGSLVGKPIIISKLVPEGIAYVMNNEAVTCFIKKDTFVEQSRDVEKKNTTMVADNYMIIAQTNDTKARKVVLDSAISSVKAFNVVQNAALPARLTAVLSDSSEAIFDVVYSGTYATDTLGVIEGTPKVKINGKEHAVVITVVAAE